MTTRGLKPQGEICAVITADPALIPSELGDPTRESDQLNRDKCCSEVYGPQVHLGSVWARSDVIPTVPMVALGGVNQWRPALGAAMVLYLLTRVRARYRWVGALEPTLEH